MSIFLNSLFEALAGNTVVALLLGGLALGAGLLRRPALAHALWVLVLIKLVTPPLVSLPMFHVAQAPAIAEAMPAQVSASVQRGAEAVEADSGPPSAQMPAIAPAAAPPAQISPPMAAPPPSPSRVPVVSVGALLAAGWVTGSLVIMVVMGSRVVQFRRLIRASPAGPAGVEAEIRGLSAFFGIGRAPRSLIVPATIPPVLFSLGGPPVLLLPARILEGLSLEERRGILAHEIAHLKRRDHLVRLLEMAATCVLWWHPLLWVARWNLRRVEEQACDALVLARMPDCRATYATALVETLEWIAGPPRAKAVPAFVSSLGQLNGLQRRLTMILDHQPSMNRISHVLLVAAALALPLAPTLGQGTAAPGPVPAGTPPKKEKPEADAATSAAVKALLETATDANPQVGEAALLSIHNFGGKALPALLEAIPDKVVGPFAADLVLSLQRDALDQLITAYKSDDPKTRQIVLRSMTKFFYDPNRREGPFASMTGLGMGGLLVGEGTPGMASATVDAAGTVTGLTITGPGTSFTGQRVKDAGFPGGPGGTVVRNGLPPLAFNSIPFGSLDDFNQFMSKVGPVVEKALSDPDAQVRMLAVEVWGHILHYVQTPADIPGQPPTALSLKGLPDALKDKDAEVRQIAAHTIGTFGPQGSSAVGALIVAVGDTDAGVRREAIMALGGIGPPALEATAALTKALKDPDAATRIAAANALGSINGTGGGTGIGPVPVPMGGAVMPPTGTKEFSDFGGAGLMGGAGMPPTMGGVRTSPANKTGF